MIPDGWAYPDAEQSLCSPKIIHGPDILLNAAVPVTPFGIFLPPDAEISSVIQHPIRGADPMRIHVYLDAAGPSTCSMAGRDDASLRTRHEVSPFASPPPERPISLRERSRFLKKAAQKLFATLGLWR